LSSIHIPANKFVSLADRPALNSMMMNSTATTEGERHMHINTPESSSSSLNAAFFQHHSEPENETPNLMSSWEEDTNEMTDDAPPFDNTNLIGFGDGVCAIALELYSIILKILDKVIF